MGNRRFTIILVATFILSILSSMVQAASFQGLGYLDGQPIRSEAFAVSDDGSTVVGQSNSAFGNEAFRWTQLEGMIGLGDLPGGAFVSQARCVSAGGSVIAGSGIASSGGKQASYWTQETDWIKLGFLLPGSGESLIMDMSSDGSILAGWGSGGSTGLGDQPFRWTQETGMVHLGTLGGQGHARGISSDGEVIVGHSQSSSSGGNNEAFLWTHAEGMVGLGDLPGGIFESMAYSVNLDGSVIVGCGNSSIGQEAFSWTESGGMIGLGDLLGGDFFSIAHDVSADGSVVVGESKSAIGSEAFIWDADNGMRNLKDVLVSDYGLDLTDWTLTSARGISADGLKVVGFGINPDGYWEAWIATVPEHTSIPVAVDIKPGSCPNPLNTKSRGVLPVAILGSDSFDANTIDPTSVRLNEVEPIRNSLEDVSSPLADPNECECSTNGPDGFVDLTLKFKTQEIVESLGEVNTGDILTLPLTGVLNDETPIEGADCVVIVGKHKPVNKADINKDGLVNAVDIAIVAENWLESSIVEK